MHTKQEVRRHGHPALSLYLCLSDSSYFPFSPICKLMLTDGLAFDEQKKD